MIIKDNIIKFYQQRQMGLLQSKNNFRWVDRYELIDTDNNDQLLKLMSRVGESQYIGKEYTCHGKEKIELMEKAIDRKVLTPCPYLMKLVRVGVKVDTLSCNDSKVYCLIYRKPSKSIKEESIFRKVRDQAFSQEDILCILDSCVNALNYLRQMGQFHSKVSSSNIYINQDRTIVLGDPWLLTGDKNFNQSMHGIIYPSPEKILFKNGFIEQPDKFLSDLFSLGVVLLEMYLLQHMDAIYEKGYKRILETKLISKLNLINSKQLKKKMKILLSNQPYKRYHILKELSLVDSKAETFISHEKDSFKQEYIRSMLVTSEVKTVKMNRRDYDMRDRTLIHRVDTSRNPSDFSSDTIVQNKQSRPQPAQQLPPLQHPQHSSVQELSSRAPLGLAPPVPMPSNPRQSNEPQSRSTFTFYRQKEAFQQPDVGSISSIAKNDQDQSRDNIQLQLFEYPRKYADHYRQKNEKRSLIMRSSGFLQSHVTSQAFERPQRGRNIGGIVSNVSRQSKNSTLNFNVSRGN